MWVPDAAHEALRDLVRAREDAREDQQRARQQLGKFLLRHGFQRPKDIKEGWTQKLMAWIKSQVRLEQAASQAAFLDYVHEVERATDRLQQLEKAIDDAIAAAPAEIQDQSEEERLSLFFLRRRRYGAGFRGGHGSV